MVICQSLGRISTRKNGVLITFEKGDSFESTEVEAKRLEGIKMVKILDTIPNEEQDIAYLTEVELEGKNKESLVAYASKIGLELIPTMKKDAMIHEIIDYIEELEM